MRALIATIAALAMTAACFAQTGMGAGGEGVMNIYALTEWISPGGNNTTAGKTAVSCTVPGGQKTALIIVAGQSLGGNHGVSLYTPTNSKTYNLNVYDGNCYQLSDPILGCDGTSGTYISRLADDLINAGKYTAVIVVDVNIGGTTVFDWAPNAAPFTQDTTASLLASRLRVAWLRVRQQGYDKNPDVHPFVIWDQGVQDNVIGTSEASYVAGFNSMKSTLTGMGYAGPWFTVDAETMLSNTVDATIQAAQASLVDNVTVFAGANTDSLTGGTNRQSDGTHLTDTGNASNASLWETAISAHLP